MNKLFILFGLILLAVSVFAFNSSFVLRDVLVHPNSYDRLPDNLAPYCCGVVVDGKCSGKVDLETASEMVKKGLNPSVNYVVDKSSLRCN
jgi:hypothetical protein